MLIKQTGWMATHHPATRSILPTKCAATGSMMERIPTRVGLQLLTESDSAPPWKPLKGC